MELTSKTYWQEYYEDSAEDRETIRRICGRYDHYYEMLINACQAPPTSILEIGAFPGRYLAYLGTKYGLEPTGIDFNPDKEKFERSMRAMGVSEYEYICADFLKQVPHPKYDVVFSNGFVEHFINYDKVLDLHAGYLRPGGAMMVLIPNKRYFRKIYGYLLDYKNLKAHNLDCMRLEVFEDFAFRNGLQINYLSYDGGFAYRVHQSLNILQRLIYKPVRFLSLKLDHVLSRNPSRWYSGTIVAIFSRKSRDSNDAH